VTFVFAPVAASGLGAVSPAFAIFLLAAVGAAPGLLVPNTGAAHLDGAHGPKGSILRPSILLWLGCAAAGGAAIAAIEIGAVALALNFGYEPTLAIVFTVPLCLASVSGGVWASVRNRMAKRTVVLAQLLCMTLGSAIAAFNFSVTTTVIGTILIGSVLATYYSLVLDRLAPPQQRAEVFALLRTANAAGVILASAALALVSLSVALIVVSGLMVLATISVAIASAGSQALPSGPILRPSTTPGGKP
jgi:hypothetical protein